MKNCSLKYRIGYYGIPVNRPILFSRINIRLCKNVMFSPFNSVCYLNVFFYSKISE